MGHTSILPTGRAKVSAAAALIGGLVGYGYLRVVGGMVYTTDANQLKRTSVAGKSNFSAVATLETSSPSMGLSDDAGILRMRVKGPNRPEGGGSIGVPGGIGVFDTATSASSVLHPSDLANDYIPVFGIDADDNYVYTLSERATMVVKRNKITGESVAAVSVAALVSPPSALSLHRGAGQLLITSYGDGAGLRVDTATMTVVGAAFYNARQRGRAVEVGDYLYMTGESNFPYPGGAENAAVLRVNMVTGAVTTLEIPGTKYGALSLGGMCARNGVLVIAYPDSSDQLVAAQIDTATFALTETRLVDVPAASWAGQTVSDCALDSNGYLWVRAAMAACAFTGISIK